MKLRGKALLIPLLVLAIAVGVALSGCAIVRREPISVGPTVTEQRSVSGFDHVTLSGPDKLVVQQGSGYSLQVSGSRGALNTLRTQVRGSTLLIERTGGLLDLGLGGHGIEITLTVPQLAGIRVTGAGDATVTGLTSTDFDATVSGGSRLALTRLTARSLQADISGAGELTATGQATGQDIHVSGAGRYDGLSLAGADVRVDVSGGARASVAASATLAANASGGGRIEYTGNPTVTQHASGGASVVKQ